MLTKADIEKYFIAEKQESLLFLILGIIAIVTAIVLLIMVKNNFWRGFAIPLIAIGLVQAIVGFNVYKRSDADRVRVVYAHDLNPYDLKTKELPRMQKVIKNFIVYRWVEIAFLAIAIILIVLYKNNAVVENSWKGNAFAYGLGVALAIQSVNALVSDFFAEKRAAIYTQLLQQKIEKEFGNK